jgi:hypothetical protein
LGELEATAVERREARIRRWWRRGVGGGDGELAPILAHLRWPLVLPELAFHDGPSCDKATGDEQHRVAPAAVDEVAPDVGGQDEVNHVCGQ